MALAAASRQSPFAIHLTTVISKMNFALQHQVHPNFLPSTGLRLYHINQFFLKLRENPRAPACTRFFTGPAPKKVLMQYKFSFAHVLGFRHTKQEAQLSQRLCALHIAENLLSHSQSKLHYCVSFYQYSIVTTSLSCTVFEISTLHSGMQFVHLK